MKAEVCTFELEELLATKLRALYQRNCGRDILDIWLALEQNEVVCERVIEICKHYFDQLDEKLPTLCDFESTLLGKIRDHIFLSDTDNLVRKDLDYSVRRAMKTVHNRLIVLLEGKPYSGDELEQFFRGEHSLQNN